ncbi:glycosyltransferase family 61 protein [Paracoccus sp. (in: a-proteobacteria)]|uniref:glycosyltransferase family 61 protein n=1 Tax=Paracoccus sp. TaxID=267 RepID=UPI002AFE0DAA|nr:glycosyltransferase family 61 protein [Paracoccus sp. (in: a-proteobacteria)]
MVDNPKKQFHAHDIFIPGVDEGLRLAYAQSLETGRDKPANISFLSLSSNDDHRLTSYRLMWKKPAWEQSVTTPTVLAVADNLEISPSETRINGKVLLNSAKGARFRNRIVQTNKTLDAEITAYLTEKSFRNRRSIQADTTDFRDLSLVIEAKNFFNYYHFLKESFPVLMLYKQHNLTGNIIFYSGKGSVADFVISQCKTWFPELLEKIVFDASGDSRKFARALLGLNTSHLYFQCRNRVMKSIDDVGVEVGRRASVRNFQMLGMNAYEQPLADFRKHALALARPDPKPKRRLFVTRKSKRVRSIDGEEHFLQLLERLNFETISFEDYSTLEQAKLVAEAEAVVILHGAGITNMLYAQPGCHFIELSNLQTLKKRYGDFLPLAIASGAHYCHVFLDHDFDDPDTVPSIALHGLRGVRMSQFQSQVTASWIAALLHPEEFEEARRECAELNDQRDFSKLTTQLDKHSHLLQHLADAHVWTANCLNDGRDLTGSLDALRRALILAPRRHPLIKRILTLAHRIEDKTAFDQACLHARRYGGEDMQAFFQQNGWIFHVTNSNSTPSEPIHQR